MSGQPYVYLIVLFLMVGFFSYNQYLVNKGELSLVSQIIDFAGIAEYSKKEPSVEIIKKQSQVRLQNRLGELSKFHKEIQEKRIELIRKRREILTKIKEVNGRLEEEAATFAEIIDKEREAFLDEFPELEKFHKEIVEFKNISDEDLRIKKYQEIKDALLTSLAEKSVRARRSDVFTFEYNLATIEKIVVGQNENDVAYCGGFEECLDKYVKDIESYFKKVHIKNAERENAKLEELTDITSLLENEYDLLSENFESSEVYLQKNNQKIESELKDLSEQLVDITDREFGDLMDLYDELMEEQEMVLDNLKISLVRFKDAEERVNSIINNTIKLLTNTPGKDLDDLVKAGNAWNLERISLAKQLESNESILSQDIRDHWQGTQDMINDMLDTRNQIIELSNINAKDRRYSQTNRGSVNWRTSDPAKPDSSNVENQLKNNRSRNSINPREAIRARDSIKAREAISASSHIDMRPREVRSSISDSRNSDKYDRQFQKYQKFDSPKQQRRDARGLYR